ncbi:MAG: ABC transporter ATP-binding protein, partial [Oligoflexia bacterium]|nr:ABC transporter ATP-binding protein [Oligoflexia bacterium]
MTRSALQIRGMVKRYRSGLLGLQIAAPAVDGVDLDVAPGEVVALVGESGSGKTTLARCALALLRPDQGQVRVLDTPIHKLRGRALDRFRRRVQPVFQDPDAHLNPGLRVREILTETARLHRPGDDEAGLIDDVLAQVGLDHRQQAMPHELSGGERRRVGIARILMTRPELVIADEPTAGLDAARKADLMALLLGPKATRHASLVISHDLPLMASCVDRLAVMVAGRIVERMTAADLDAPVHHPYTSTLLQAAGLLRGERELHEIGEADNGFSANRAVGSSRIGCPLSGRCRQEVPVCATLRPPQTAHSPSHHIACHALALARQSASPDREPARSPAPSPAP